MELKMKSDHDWGCVFWRGKGLATLCHHTLKRVIDISERVETIYIVTAPKAPARVNGGAFRLHREEPVIHEGDPLEPGLERWLLEQYESGDRYAWIEY